MLRVADCRRARRAGRSGAGDRRDRAARSRSNALDAAFKGEALTLPSEGLIGDRMEMVDPDAIHAAPRALARRDWQRACRDELGEAQAAGAAGSDLSPQAKGIRRLKTVSLALLAAAIRRAARRWPRRSSTPPTI